MKIEILYMVVLLAVIIIWFVFFKRPIYEAMFLGFVVILFLSNSVKQFLPLIVKTSANTLFYAIFAFLMLAFIFSETGVVNDINDIIIAVFGKFRGGAGYVSLITSAFMAALSGSGPGNVAATGVFTIPPMVKSGYPKALAASVAMSSSSLGPMIPPSGTILLAYGVLDTLFPGTYDLSKFWIIVWIIGLYFVAQRIITLYVLIRILKIKPMKKEEIPNLREALSKGWKAILVPLLIFAPLLFDNIFSDGLITSRIGPDGAKAFSSSVIQFTPGIAALYAFMITRHKFKEAKSLKGITKLIKKALSTVVPVSATIYFAYCISSLFGMLEIGPEIGNMIENLGLSLTGIAFFMTVFCCILGMFLPGSAQIAIFGVAFTSSMVTAGLDPLIAAAILPALTGALEGMTPPLALSMYAAMGIAGSDFGETTKYALIWVLTHMLILILIIAKIFPIIL